MALPKVIGICGKMGAGKDEVGNILRDNHGYLKTSFAQELRKEVFEALNGAYLANEKARKHFPVIPRDMETSSIKALQAFEAIVAQGDEIQETDFGVWTKPTSPNMRTLLQWWGTEYRRTQDENYWAKKWLIEWLPALLDGERLCICDVRYNNEAAMCKLMGAIWEVYGRNCKNEGLQGHASEKGVSLVFEMYLPNHGTLEELTKTVDWLLREEK